MTSKPAVFVGSSVEGLDIANAIAHYLKYDARVTTWSGAFDLSNTTIEDLEQRIAHVDFGIIVLSPDDHTELRDEVHTTPRDNVLLELGMLIGRVGRRRTFFVVPSDQDMHLPTDLLGVTPATYEVDWAKEEGKAREALSAASGEIRAAIKRLGPIVEADAEGANSAVLDAALGGPSQAQAPASAPAILDAGPGDRRNGWGFFAEQGWLPALSAAALPTTRWVVHPRFGLGEIIGHGPTGQPELEVTARFATGDARLMCPPDILFDTSRA